MEKRVVELMGIVLKMVIRYWAKDNENFSQNIIDIEQFAIQCGLSVWDAKRINRSIDEFIDLIAENFIKEFGTEIQEKERKRAIVAQIQEDVRRLKIDEKKITIELSAPENLRNAIMKQSEMERQQWDDQEVGLYTNCVRYISKACIDFVSKLPSFTPEALKIVIRRQE